MSVLSALENCNIWPILKLSTSPSQSRSGCPGKQRKNTSGFNLQFPKDRTVTFPGPERGRKCPRRCPENYSSQKAVRRKSSSRRGLPDADADLNATPRGTLRWRAEWKVEEGGSEWECLSDAERAMVDRILNLDSSPCSDNDEVNPVALGTGAPGLCLGCPDHGSSGPGATFPLPGSPVATACLPAGVRWLLRPGHCGLSRGHLSRLRGRRPRAAEPDPGGPSGFSPQGATLLTPSPIPSAHPSTFPIKVQFFVSSLVYLVNWGLGTGVLYIGSQEAEAGEPPSQALALHFGGVLSPSQIFFFSF